VEEVEVDQPHLGADLALTVTLIILLVVAVLLIANLIGAINVFG
jgi:hypothetical protein